MSAIAAAFAFGGEPLSQSEQMVGLMLDAMRRLGQDHRSVSGPLGVLRNSWESHGQGNLGVVSDGAVHVAAVASIYYRSDLRARLARAGVAVDGAASGPAMVLAAYLAFGPACVDVLEGDFAFVVWDAPKARLMAARDFTGRHTLYFAQTSRALFVASTAAALLQAPGVSDELSMTTFTSVAAGLWGHSNDTVYRDITELAAGHRLMATVDGVVTTERYWHPPDREVRSRESLADVSERVRELLVAAVAERLSDDGPTAVSLSGGWDSPSVFAAGQVALERRPGPGRSLRAVSISFPEGDPGREDELIQAIVGRWNTSTRWKSVDHVPVFLDPERAAAEREEPFAHGYENWNRELARAAREVGARVMLDGSGGDQLFQISTVFMSDLFRRGRWLEFTRQWKQRGQPGLKALYRATVRQNLPPAAAALIARVRRTSAPVHYLHRDAPAWFRRGFMQQHGVLERDVNGWPQATGNTHALNETQAFLLFPFYGRIARLVTRFSMEEGVEQRSPLLDRRLVEYAAPRPWYEKANGGETKLTLRGAMRGLLPDEVLAPRRHRTGVTSAYFMRQLTGPGRPYFESMLKRSVLVEIGMVEPGRLRRAWEYFLAHEHQETGSQLYFTLQAEFWLRARIS